MFWITSFPQILFTRNPIIILQFFPNHYRIFEIFNLSMIFKMFPGTFQNVPMFLNFWKKCSVRTEQNMFCQNIEKMFCQNRTFPRTLLGLQKRLRDVWYLDQTTNLSLIIIIILLRIIKSKNVKDQNVSFIFSKL